jgi:nucleolar MIF4G domain-containing protein 1
MSESVSGYSQEESQESKGKECSNLVVLLSELYNFQVISSVLIFDLVRQLLGNDLTEFDVELLLKLMRST